jgi:replicative DNA helicase
MTITELEERIDLLSLIERSYKTKKVGANLHRLNNCPGCESDKGFTIYTDTNSYHSFCGCYQGGKAYKYLMEVEGMNEDQAYNELLALTGQEKSPTISKPTKATEIIEPLKDYTNLILELYNKQSDQDKQYFINRGLTLETIDKYKLCIGDIKGYGGARAIIPTWKDNKVVFYTGRALTKVQEDYRKYDNVNGKAYLFNSNILKKLDPGSKVLVTESQIDTMLLEQLGFNSVSLSSSNNTNLLKENIEAIPGAKDLKYYTIFDNDKAGDIARSKLDYKHLKVDNKYNDVGEWYIQDKEKVTQDINNQIDNFKRPNSLYNYMTNNFTDDINAYKEFKDRKTGFKNLDEITSLYPGLYVIGGLSTLGKTTFIHQMTDQMAEQGEHILFFSLEMATLELITKSIARLTVLNKEGYNFNNGVSSLQVRLNDIPGSKRATVQQAIKDYEPISKRFNIIEGNFNTNIHTIREYVNNYIKDNKVKPVVVIDYLQIIPGSENSSNSKEKIDQIVTGLKQISRDYNITVIVVSSLNRSNYLTPIDFESFKESGGIEYTADVVWGLQLQAINDEIFNSPTKIKEKREKINEAKKSNPRKIELVCLKNRNGISNYNCNFTYYPKYDLFISEDNTSNNNQSVNNNTRRL